MILPAAADVGALGLGPGCGRPVDKADTGSAFADGHGFRAPFFLPCHAFASFPGGCCCDPSLAGADDDGATMAVMADDADEDEETEDEELVRWTPLRGRNMRDTSSVLMLLRLLVAALPACHVGRGPGCRLGSGATAVI